MDTLPSPCDQPVSLRKSMQPSARCPRGEFAARYVEFLIDEGADAGQATLRYENRYVYPQRYELDLDYTPYTGDPDAPVVLVEFLDYACPACRALAPRLDQLARDSDGEVVLYYKMFPLTEQHPHSHGAARAALAAHQQGEFRAMHERLFARPKQHETEQLMEHARDLGLDMEAFEQAFHDARAAVDADLAEGNGAELTRTPSLFVNGKLFTDGMSRRYLGHWIQEELAVHTPD